jgi:hypothetical protein
VLDEGPEDAPVDGSDGEGGVEHEVRLLHEGSFHDGVGGHLFYNVVPTL